MYEIVANKKNSLDVDKIDYLQRDAMHLGMKVGFDKERLLNNARIINNQLCYNGKVYLDIEQVFRGRYILHKDCYSHRVARGIDFMIVDALLAANDYFHFEEAIRNPEEYTKITDHVLRHIQRSSSPSLKTSRDILTRIDRRNLYSCLT